MADVANRTGAATHVTKAFLRQSSDPSYLLSIDTTVLFMGQRGRESRYTLRATVLAQFGSDPNPEIGSFNSFREFFYDWGITTLTWVAIQRGTTWERGVFKIVDGGGVCMWAVEKLMSSNGDSNVADPNGGTRHLAGQAW